MAAVSFNTLYCNGDSWTAGDIVDPELFGDNLAKVNDPLNKPYRLPRVWPHKLAKKLGVECINNAHAGASNDRIVRSTINDVTELLNTKKPEEIFAIIGWSSPERKDFYYKADKNNSEYWFCVYPAEFRHWNDDNKDLNDFFKLYINRFWNKEEYLSRHCLNVLSLHHFLKSKNIKHFFFDCFYEDKEGVIDENTHQLYEQPSLQNNLKAFYTNTPKKKLERLDIQHSLQEVVELYKKLYPNETFLEYIRELEKNKFKPFELVDYHPTEFGHDFWSNYLYNFLKCSKQLI
jgi:hypothetical protein